MKNITLGRGACVTIHTPNGKVVVGTDDPYNAGCVTALYFGDILNRTTITVTLDELLRAYEDNSELEALQNTGTEENPDV